jgi:hypothetical protein
MDFQTATEYTPDERNISIYGLYTFAATEVAQTQGFTLGKFIADAPRRNASFFEITKGKRRLLVARNHKDGVFLVTSSTGAKKITIRAVIQDGPPQMIDEEHVQYLIRTYLGREKQNPAIRPRP